jgi:prepilin peptidase CpaA
MNYELIFAIILTAMLLVVAVYDATKFIIPNWLNYAFVLLYAVFVLVSPKHIEWLPAIIVMLCFFAVGFLIFMANIMGGGDVKLLIALSIWIGWQPNALLAFGLWTALAGGILAIFLVFTRVICKRLKTKNMPRIFCWREPLPYGLAIAYAFGLLLWTGQISGLVIN